VNLCIWGFGDLGIWESFDLYVFVYLCICVFNVLFALAFGLGEIPGPHRRTLPKHRAFTEVIGQMQFF
jgi:hypothetical protein